MYNKVLLIGNLTRDVELRYVQNGLAIGKSAIAVNRKYKTQMGETKEEVMFVDITFFGKTAEIANQYLAKGKKVFVEGRLSFEQWVDNNGQNRSKHSVQVDTLQMLDSKGSVDGDSEYSNMQQSQSSQNQNSYSNNKFNQQQKSSYKEQVPDIDINEEPPF